MTEQRLACSLLACENKRNLKREKSNCSFYSNEPLSFGVFKRLKLYLFRCRVDGPGGVNVGDLRTGVGRRDSL